MPRIPVDAAALRRMASPEEQEDYQQQIQGIQRIFAVARSAREGSRENLSELF